MSTRTRAVVHDVLPALLPEVFPGFGENAALEIPAVSAKVERS